MGSKSSPPPPPVPDYAGAATAQGAANKESAIASSMLSNPNIYSPYGSQTVSYSEGPNGNLVPTVTQSLNPQSQAIFDQQQNVRQGLANISGQALNTAQGVLSTPFSFGGPGVQTSIDNPTLTMDAGQNGYAGQRNRLDLSGVAKMPINAGMTGQEAILSRLEPTLARQRTSLETQLTNQGLRPGSEAWDNATRDFSQQATDQRTQAALQGIGLDMTANNQGYQQALSTGQFGNQANLTNAQFMNAANLANAQFQNAAAGQQFNQNLQAGQFGNTAQQQALAQAIQSRQMPLNEISALMSGSQIQNPQFQPYTGQTIQAAPLMQAAQAQGQAGLQQYGIQQGAANANMGGLYQLGGAGLMAYGLRPGV